MSSLLAADPLSHALDVVEQLREEGREDDAMKLLDRVLDALQERATRAMNRTGQR